MPSRKRPAWPPAAPGPDEKRYVVRWYRGRKCLAADPVTEWRYTEPESATLMTLDQARRLAEKFVGVVCLDGVPVDKLGVAPPAKPKDPGPKRAAGAESLAAARVREAVAAENWREAVRLALKVRNLGEDAKVLERAWDAFTRPDFCRQLKRDPGAMIQAAVDVVKRRWGSP